MTLIKCTTAAQDLNIKLEVLAGVLTPHVGNLEITLSHIVCVCVCVCVCVFVSGVCLTRVATKLGQLHYYLKYDVICNPTFTGTGFMLLLLLFL